MQRAWEFRSGPVPHTGKNRWSFGRRYRRFSTFAERRDSFKDIEFVRPRRNAVNIPSAWDDFDRGQTRSWKKHRRKQWKPV